MIERTDNYYNETLLERQSIGHFSKGEHLNYWGHQPSSERPSVLGFHFLALKGPLSFHFFIKALSRNIVD